MLVPADYLLQTCFPVLCWCATPLECNTARVDISPQHQLANCKHNWVRDSSIHCIILGHEKQVGYELE